MNYAANPLSLADFASNPRDHFAQTDLAAPDAPAILVEHFTVFQPDWIIHLAAETHVDRSIDAPAAFIESNVFGTTALLEAARIYFAQLKGTDRKRFRLLDVSTDEVYGTLSAADSPLSEGSAYAPRSPSPRGELEIADLNRLYLERSELHVEKLPPNTIWFDLGTHKALASANLFMTMMTEKNS